MNKYSNIKNIWLIFVVLILGYLSIAQPVQSYQVNRKWHMDNYLSNVRENCSIDVICNTVAEMRGNTNLSPGQTTITKGYHTINDGGAAVYNIRVKNSNDVENGGSIIILDNDNVAELLSADYVTVEQFGALGDGTTDDTISIDNAIEYAIANGVRVQLLAKTYILDSRHIHDRVYSIPDRKNLWINGQGKSSVIKRKNLSVSADTQSLFYIRPDSANTKDIGEIHFSNLMIDSNARNNTPADSGFTYEHCADVRITGYPNSHVKSVIIENVWATDGVADHFYFPNTKGVGDNFTDTVTVNNFYVENRDRKRSDLCFTGYVPTVKVSDSKFVVLEYEYNISTANRTSLFVVNTELERIDLAGGVNIHATNINVKKSTYLSSLSGRISNSKLALGNKNRLRATHGILFTDCTFILNVVGTTINHLRTEAKTDVTFERCNFVVDYNGKDKLSGNCVHFVTTNANVRHFALFDDCKFDSRSQYGVYIDRMVGDFVLQNVLQTDNIGLVCLSGTANYPINVTLKNISIRNGFLGKFQINSSSLKMENVVVYGYDNAKIMRGNSLWINNAKISGGRKIIVTEPITSSTAMSNSLTGGYFKDDVYVNISADKNEPQKWKRTQTGYCSKTSEFFKNVVKL